MNLIPNVVDLSHYDNVTDWDAVKAFGILGVINKATEGPRMVDLTFAERRPEAAKRGILYAGYHFLRPGSVTAQVRHFLDVIGDTKGIGLALDHEDPAVPLASARAFCEQVHGETGRYPWLYSGFLIKQQLGARIDPFWRAIPLWLSHYNANPKWPPCWDKPFLWQFTGDGQGPGPHTVPGIAARSGIDINSFDGTAAELAAQWVGGAASTSTPPEVVALPAEPEQPILRKGSNDGGTSGPVHDLQTLLNNRGAVLKVDGDFGVQTKAEVEIFQTKSGLLADGIVGAVTWKALKEKT